MPNASPARRSPFRRLGAALAYLVYLLAAVLLLLYLFAYRPYRASLAEIGGAKTLDTTIPYIDEVTMRRVGSLARRSSVHFGLAALAKPDGVIRVCAMGDSATAGDEVSADLDYPSLLQREFRSLGADNVEVINFGNGWHGFSQISVMWQDVARRFHCDLVTLVAESFWWRRDTTFHHSGSSHPYYLHARHVLDGDDLRLLEVSGANARARFDRYHAFLPRWRYLRYDYNPPALVRAMLPAGTRLPNPLYYQDDPRREAYEIHRRLLHRLAADPVQVVVVTSRPGNYQDILADGAPDNIAFADRLHLEDRFPYMAPIWHRSGWGNQRLARSLVRMLLAEPPPAQPWLHFVDQEAGADGPTPPPLSGFERLTVTLDDATVGVLVSVHDRRQEEDDRHRATAATAGIGGLLAVTPGDESVLRGCLLPLDRPLSPGETVTVEGGDGGSVTLGEARPVAPGVAIWVLRVEGAWCNHTGPLRLPLVDAVDDAVDGPVTLVAGDSRWPAQRAGDQLALGTGGRPLYKFAALGMVPSDVDALSDEGTASFVLEQAGQRTVVPFSRYQRRPADATVRVRVPPRQAIVIEAGRARLVPAGG